MVFDVSQLRALFVDICVLTRRYGTRLKFVNYLFIVKIGAPWEF